MVLCSIYFARSLMVLCSINVFMTRAWLHNCVSAGAVAAPDASDSAQSIESPFLAEPDVPPSLYEDLGSDHWTGGRIANGHKVPTFPARSNRRAEYKYVEQELYIWTRSYSRRVRTELFRREWKKKKSNCHKIYKNRFKIIIVWHV